MHQYQLQRYSGMRSKHRCPKCQHRQKTFKLYINTQTNEPLNDKVGKCDRLDKCGYHFTPKMYFAENGIAYSDMRIATLKQNIAIRNTPISIPSYIPNQIFTASLSRYEQNNLVEFLRLLFGDEVTTMLIERYYIGTSKHWYGATVFWQVDMQGQVRTGKIMLYNATNAKRVKLRAYRQNNAVQRH